MRDLIEEFVDFMGLVYIIVLILFILGLSDLNQESELGRLVYTVIDLVKKYMQY